MRSPDAAKAILFLQDDRLGVLAFVCSCVLLCARRTRALLAALAFLSLAAAPAQSQEAPPAADFSSTGTDTASTSLPVLPTVGGGLSHTLQDPESGRLARRFIGADVYEASEQNWEATQTPDGTLYVANTEGVVVYDGRWHTLPTANRGIVRSIASDAAGHVYVGGQREIGVVQHDSLGQRCYVSLLEHVPPDDRVFTDVWRTEATSAGVYFQSYRRLFRWSPATQSMHVWRTDARFRFADVVRDTLFVNVEGEGLAYVDGDSLQWVSGGDMFADEYVGFLMPHGAGGLLVGTRNRLHARSGDTFRPFATDVDTLLQDAWVYGGLRGPEETIVLGTIDQGAILLSPEGALLRRLKANEKPVTGLFMDREHGLWTLLDGGLMRYDLGAPYTMLGPESGLAGGVEDILRHKGMLYMATTRGTYRLAPSPNGPAVAEAIVTAAQCWSLVSTREGLLIGKYGGLFQYRPEAPAGRRLTGLLEVPHVYDVLRSRLHPARLYAATGRGVRLLVRRGGRWVPGPRLDSLDTEARALAEADDGTLWVGTTFDGVYRLRFEGTGPVPTSTTVDRYTAAHGLPPGSVDPHRWNGQVVFGTSAGILRFAPRPTPRFVRVRSIQNPPSENAPSGTATQRSALRASGPASATAGGGGVEYIQKTAAGKAWGHLENGPAHWVRRDTLWQWAPRVVHRLRHRTPYSLYAEGDGPVWIGLQETVMRYAPGRLSPEPPRARIRWAATQATDSLLHVAAVPGATAGAPVDPPPAEIPHTERGVRIAYSAPSLVRPEGVAYQYRVAGYAPKWSTWTTQTEHLLSGLGAGTYTFEVRARTAYGDTTQAARLTFAMRPPWYHTPWAYAAYVLCSVVLVGGLVQWRTQRLRQRQRQLEARVAERTEQIRDRNTQLAEQAERLRSLDEAKNRFFANISHEFRTPLTLIRGPLQTLCARLQQHERPGTSTSTASPGSSSASRLLPSDAERLAIAQRNTDRLERMIDHILRLAQMDAGTYPLNARPLDLHAATARIVTAFEPLAAQKQVVLTLQPRPASSGPASSGPASSGPASSGPERVDSTAGSSAFGKAQPASAEHPPVYVDPEALQYILSNLLSNAIKFTPPDGRVTVAVAPGPEAVRLRVADTGVGIAPAKQAILFDRFAQADDTSTREAEGAGIGLAFARELTDLHGGTITVESAEDKGATFTVRFRRGRAHLDDDQLDDSRDGPGAGSRGPATTLRDAAAADVGAMPPPVSSGFAPASGASSEGASPSEDASGHDRLSPASPEESPDAPRRVLVVDDNADLRYHIRSILEPAFEVVEATNGAEGLDKARALLPDLILADVMMPQMNGRTMTRELRATPATATVPIILVTARTSTRDELQGLQDGATDYIRKPFDAAVLEQRVRGLLSMQERLQRRLRQQAARASRAAPNRHDTAPEELSEATDDDFAACARTAIERHLSDPNFSVAALTEALPVSRPTLYRRFDETFGISPGAMITKMRLERAARLLAEDAGTVSEVAYAVGFSRVSSFSRAFHKQMGVPPSAYVEPL
jgi:signal transduction histidine kinase/AraC-like DNA-binding protein